ncbi:MAG: RNA polymerase sigma-70 factor [Bacteroidia bacterium]
MDIGRFEQIYKTYQPGMVNFANYYLKNEQEAIDTVQEIFMNIWQKKEDFLLTENPKAYLMTSVKNRCLNKLTRKKYEQKPLDTLNDVFISEDNTIANIEARQMEAAIKNSVGNLPDKCKEIFILSRYEHMSYKEIAALLGLSVKTVENQIGNALKMIRKNIFNFLLLAISILQNILDNI